MIEKSNSKNCLAKKYYKLEKRQRVQFRRKMGELFGWDSEKTFYNKVRTEYTPSRAEEIVSEMIIDDLNLNN